MTGLLALALLLADAKPNRVIVVYGQSNARASAATSLLSLTQDGGSVMFATSGGDAVRDGGFGCSLSATSSTTIDVDAGSLIPLIATDTEKPHVGAANWIFENYGTNSMGWVVAWGGYPIDCLDRGTGQTAKAPWTAMLRGFANAGRAGAFHNHGTTALPQFVWIQGEQDENDGTPAATYAVSLEQLQSQLEGVASGYAQFSTHRRLFMLQAQSWTASNRSVPTAAIGMYNFARNRPDVAALIGPTYFLPTHPGSEIHRSSIGACQSAAIIGQALQADAAWTGFKPLAAPTLSGSTITATFHVPVCPMVVDTTTITGVSTSTRGFEYTCSSSPPSISSVTNTSCSGTTGTLTIALSGTPDGTCQTDDKLRYAYTGTSGNDPGPTSGARGNMRDSRRGAAGGTFNCGGTTVNLDNFLVTFEETVN